MAPLLSRFPPLTYARTMLAFLLTFTAFLGFLACDGPPAEPEPTPVLPTRTITVTSEGGSSATITVELATTPQERSTGLMHRSFMAEEKGMLFLFPGTQTATHGFWMHNTLIPLTIAYLDDEGRIVAMRDGQPLDDTVLEPGAPYRSVLEMNQGWFERHGMGIGSIVHLPADLPTPS